MSSAFPLSETCARSHPGAAVAIDADELVDWLLGSLRLDTTVFHVGQYCGEWHASTAGRAVASYHLVLHGRCFVHIEGQAPIALGPRDGIFFLKDVRHFLSSDASSLPPIEGAPMSPLSKPSPGTTGLACGFFHFRGALSHLIVGGFPDFLLIRSQDPGLAATSVLFDLILAEAHRAPEKPSPLIARLADALFFYVVRHVAGRFRAAAGLWSVVRRPEFARLIAAIIEEPSNRWSATDMARTAGMSRAAFFKHFEAASGKPPAQFLLLLRMRIAAERLLSGDSAAAVADQVGYQSMAAFSRAFKRAIGEHPGAYRRAPAGLAATGAGGSRGRSSNECRRASIDDCGSSRDDGANQR